MNKLAGDALGGDGSEAGSVEGFNGELTRFSTVLTDSRELSAIFANPAYGIETSLISPAVDSNTEKVRFEIGVSDHFVEPTVKAVLGAARTGDVGDGKVFVLPVEKIFRIRTGEEDRAAVTPVQVTAAGRG